MASITGVSHFDDDKRLPLQKMRRTQLFALCRQERIPITETETKDRLLMLMEGSGIDPARPPRLERDPSVTGEDTAPVQRDYAALNFYELRKLCTERKIEWAKTDKRPDLLAKLGA
jgi:hypothetical protein